MYMAFKFDRNSCDAYIPNDPELDMFVVDVCTLPLEQNTCTCENGVAATGAQCTEDGAEICTSCNDNFTLEGNTCNNNQLVTITPILEEAMKIVIKYVIEKVKNMIQKLVTQIII